MTQQNKLKRAARERAKKTGESYATARRQVVARRDRERAEATKRAASKARNATASGMVTEARCVEKTGHGFDHWFGVLDRFGAVKKGHTAAAKHLRDAHGVSAWYCQAITVGYERARGVRELNQLCTGNYQVSVSRVLPVSFERAVLALSRNKQREVWLPLEIRDVLEGRRVTRKDGAAHIRFDASGGRVELRISAKEDGRSAALASITKLADKPAMESARTAWRQILDALRSTLAS